MMNALDYNLVTTHLLILDDDEPLLEPLEEPWKGEVLKLKHS